VIYDKETRHRIVGKYAPRYAQKPDSNQPEIVTGLEKVGCSVYDASKFGGGFPDIVVGFRGLTLCLEIKIAKGKLRPSQVEFHEGWNGHSCVVHSLGEAIQAVMDHVKAHPIR
jgi:hypothetical protein